MVEEELRAVLDAMAELMDDATVPKNVKSKMDGISKILLEKQDMSIKINKALQGLEEISDDSNLQSFTRTQIWNLISILESV
jgi:uncharacterized protein